MKCVLNIAKNFVRRVSDSEAEILVNGGEYKYTSKKNKTNSLRCSSCLSVFENKGQSSCPFCNSRKLVRVSYVKKW